MTRASLLPAVLAALALAAAAPLHAQSADEVPSRWKSLRLLPSPGTREIGELLDDLKAGRVDPWALVRQLAPRAAVPAGATYQAACSAAYGAPTAIFSLEGSTPAEADGALRSVAGSAKRGALTSQEKLAQLQAMSNYARAVNTAPGVQAAVDFYKARGGRLGTVTTHYPIAWNGDAAGRELHVVVRGRNPYRAGPFEACKEMPAGPTLELTVR